MTGELKRIPVLTHPFTRHKVLPLNPDPRKRPLALLVDFLFGIQAFPNGRKNSPRVSG
jgi:hypothetical protein